MDYSGPEGIKILFYTSQCLANLSLDHRNHKYFLKEPELSILHKNFIGAADSNFFRNMVIIISNLSMNEGLNSKILQKDFFAKSLEKIYLDKSITHRKYIARAIASLCKHPQFSFFLVKNDVLKILISCIYQIQDEDQFSVGSF